MTSIQALERIAQTIPIQPGQPERIEFEYKRHGTLCQIGSWDVAEGQMITPTIRATRMNEHFVWRIFHTVQSDPDAERVFVVDRLNIHSSAEVVQRLSRSNTHPPARTEIKPPTGNAVNTSSASPREFLYSADDIQAA